MYPLRGTGVHAQSTLNALFHIPVNTWTCVIVECVFGVGRRPSWGFLRPHFLDFHLLDEILELAVPRSLAAHTLIWVAAE